MSQAAMLNGRETSWVYPQDVPSTSVFGREQEEGDSSPRVISSNIEFRCRRTKLSSASALQCESRQRRHCSMCKRSRAHDEGEFALSPVNGRTECSNPRHQVSHAQQEHESSVLPPWAAAEAYFSGRLRGEIRLFCSDERQRALMHVQTGPLAVLSASPLRSRIADLHADGIKSICIKQYALSV